jgi:hypothetical protein
MDKKKYYTVETGWITRRRVGDNVEERRSDSPDCEWFDTLEEARAAYGSEDIAANWRVEHDCSGLGRLFAKEAYKQLSIDTFEVDEDGDEVFVGREILDFESYAGEPRITDR